MTDILLYDPSAPAENETQIRRTALDGLRGRTVGVIDNAKPNFNFLVEDLTRHLTERHGVARVVVKRKRGASIPAPDAMIREIAEAADIVITGSGD
jgi:hypothetical protein